MDIDHLRAIGVNVPSGAGCVVARGAASSASSASSAPKASPKASPKAVEEVAAKKDAPNPAVAKAAAPVPAPAPAPTAAASPQPSAASKGAPKTDPVFFTDTFLYELDGCEVLEASVAEPTEKEKLPEGHAKLTIVLARTVFHPQGGGQPADNGTLVAKGLPELAVSMVSSRKEDGAVLHDCVVDRHTSETWLAAFASGKKLLANGRVDDARRRQMARLHSAGHLLDAAVKCVGLNWVPGKGFHFPDGPYVEYVLTEASRKLDPKKPKEKDEVIAEIQANMDRLVASGARVNVEIKEGVRHVEMAGEECPCGGTHVAELSQIGRVEVKKLQNKQGNVRLSYSMTLSTEAA